LDFLDFDLDLDLDVDFFDFDFFDFDFFDLDLDLLLFPPFVSATMAATGAAIFIDAGEGPAGTIADGLAPPAWVQSSPPRTFSC
jgi:hypothetical protein